jgi:hypothetical protein
MKKSDIKIGAKVQSISVVERSHEFEIAQTMTGTIVQLCSQQFAVKVDQDIEDLKYWDNLISYDYTNLEYRLFFSEWKYV